MHMCQVHHLWTFSFMFLIQYIKTPTTALLSAFCCFFLFMYTHTHTHLQIILKIVPLAAWQQEIRKHVANSQRPCCRITLLTSDRPWLISAAVFGFSPAFFTVSCKLQSLKLLFTLATIKAVESLKKVLNWQVEQQEERSWEKQDLFFH